MGGFGQPCLRTGQPDTGHVTDDIRESKHAPTTTRIGLGCGRNGRTSRMTPHHAGDAPFRPAARRGRTV